jgi:hypothetical protein
MIVLQNVKCLYPIPSISKEVAYNSKFLPSGAAVTSHTKSIYRICFINQDTSYEIYAKSVGESDMFGFLEVEEFVFGETTQILVDPSEERLKNEFADVKRTFIPMHSITRIDEVEKEGISKAVKSSGGNQGNVSPFPSSNFSKPQSGDKS